MLDVRDLVVADPLVQDLVDAVEPHRGPTSSCIISMRCSLSFSPTIEENEGCIIKRLGARARSSQAPISSRAHGWAFLPRLKCPTLHPKTERDSALYQRISLHFSIEVQLRLVYQLRRVSRCRARNPPKYPRMGKRPSRNLWIG